MGAWSYIKGTFIATWAGFKHIFRPRMTLRYPEQKLDLQGPGYRYDAKQGVGLPGFKGRHVLRFEKCTGCQLCAIACDGVAVAIDMQKVTKGKPQNKKDIWPAVDYGRCVFCGLCVTPDTEVMTNPGLKQISELTLEDHVLTHTGVYRPVTKIWNFEYSGPLYTIKAAGHPNSLTCTADHRLLGVRRPTGTRRDGRLIKTAGPVEMVLPRELKIGDYLVTPIPKRIINLNQYVVELESVKGRERLVLSTDPDLFRLIGYYLAEGSAYDPLRRVTLSFGSQEHDLISDSSLLFERYFKKAVGIDYLQHHVANVRLGSTLALQFFKQFGQGAPNKSMPDWVFFASRQKQIELIKGIWLGDGCIVNQPRQKYLNITTTSKVLASQIQSVLARIGIASAIAVEHPKDKLAAYRINVFGKWAIELAKLMGVRFDYTPTKTADRFLLTSDYFFSPIKTISQRMATKTKVMDITVDEDHTFVGMGITQHNCVDACPFDALDMTNDYELSAYDKMALKYTPDMLAVPPKLEGRKYKVEFDTKKGVSKHA
jgi:formate hydrogenlyase subunit 6/NADH:ubiquinone oxidoreductase subunit I